MAFNVTDNLHMALGQSPASLDQFGSRLADLRIPKEVDDANYNHNVSPMSMLYMRMQWGPFSRKTNDGRSHISPFSYLGVHEAEDKVFVFLVKDDKASILEDEPGLFPSDRLVTQLRMLCA